MCEINEQQLKENEIERKDEKEDIENNEETGGSEREEISSARNKRKRGRPKLIRTRARWRPG